MMEAKKAPIRVKIESRYEGGRFPGWGLYLALIDKPYSRHDVDFHRIDGTFLGFSDMDYARENFRVLNENRSWSNLFRPLELIEETEK